MVIIAVSKVLTRKLEYRLASKPGVQTAMAACVSDKGYSMITRGAGAIALATGLCLPALAEVRVGTFQVRMSVPERCEVGTDTRTVAVACTNGTPFEVSTSDQSFSARGGPRRVFPLNQGPASLSPTDPTRPTLRVVTIAY